MKPKERDELLIRLECKLNELKTDFENHLSHHFKVTLAAIGAVITAAGGIIVQLVMRGLK